MKTEARVKRLVLPRDTHGAGVCAYEAGRPLSSNPYDRGTLRYREWEGGFLDAAEDEIATERAKAAPPGVDGETKVEG